MARGPVSFCARQHDHYTRPFQGRRVVLVLFSLKGSKHLSKEERQCLCNLGFPLPSEADLASEEIPEPQSIRKRASTDAEPSASLGSSLGTVAEVLSGVREEPLPDWEVVGCPLVPLAPFLPPFLPPLPGLSAPAGGTGGASAVRFL